MMERMILDCQISKINASKQRSEWVSDLIDMNDDDAESMIDALYANERDIAIDPYSDIDERLKESRENIKRRNV
jgi:hypothetical protein